MPRVTQTVESHPQDQSRILFREDQPLGNPGKNHVLQSLADALAVISGIDVQTMRDAFGAELL